jgi:hypothetical protein
MSYENNNQSLFAGVLNLRKNRASMIMLLASAVGFGLTLWLLTWWTIKAFIPFLEGWANIIGLINGLIYGVFVFRRYRVLPEERSNYK